MGQCTKNTLPLRRTINVAKVSGVEHKYRVRDIIMGRTLLKHLESSTRAILFRYNHEEWYVWAGRELTVVPSTNDEKNPVVVEFTFKGCPHIAATPTTTTTTNTTPSPSPIPGLRELDGDAVSLTAIDDPTKIRKFPTLASAVEAARVGPAIEDGMVDYIVGGSSVHPVFYVVPIKTTGGVSPVVRRGGSTQQRVWIKA